MHILAVRSNLWLSSPNWQMDPREDRLSTNSQEKEFLDSPLYHSLIHPSLTCPYVYYYTINLWYVLYCTFLVC